MYSVSGRTTVAVSYLPARENKIVLEYTPANILNANIYTIYKEIYGKPYSYFS
jgi:hypothetical protein